MTITAETSIGSVAAEHPLATRVFARHGIDFCCGGGLPLSDACAARGVELDLVLAEIDCEIATSASDEVRWDDEPLADLIEHIVHDFHEPLREELPRLAGMAKKVYAVHREKDPERLGEILEKIQGLRTELEAHMMKEEQVLFPMILAGRGPMAIGPVSVMEAEHAHAGDMLSRLRQLTDQYLPPEDACNTWRALWAGLEDLEHQLHVHIHLENNILFPRALRG